MTNIRKLEDLSKEELIELIKHEREGYDQLVQEWKRDAERLDWLEASEDSHGFCHAGYGDYIYYVHQGEGYPSVREVIDAAMLAQREKQE